MEKMHPETDIQAFKTEANTGVGGEEPKDLNIKQVENDRSLLTLSLRGVEEEYYPWLLNLKKNKILRRTIE